MNGKPIVALGALLLVGTCLPIQAAPKLEMSRKAPFNIFSAEEPVRLDVGLRGFPAGETVVRAQAVNYFGEAVWEKDLPVTIEAKKTATAEINAGVLPPGYYEIVCKVGGASETSSLGVAALVNRTAEEARQGGCRFGLKIFEIGEPGVWWRRPLEWRLREAVDATVALGLNWTRHDFNRADNSDQPGVIGSAELTTKHDMNVVYKIEGIPETAYDAVRYGPMETFKDRTKKAWRRSTVPLKEPYQAWLREQIAKLPESQNVFEIGNEVWNYMSMEEFAEWCQLVVPVVKELRPDAIIGPDPGNIARARRFIRAGGMKGMNAYFNHPYCFAPMPEVRVRAWLRNAGDFLESELGWRPAVYITEYGWATAPKCRRGTSVSERTQAQRTTRQSLMLYAEDCKVIIPHTMGAREQDPAEMEHWWGFFRLNGQPKPVVMAHAVCAKMIDGSRFVGDLPLGAGIGAMLFDRKGTHVLALWTLDEALGSGREIVLETGAPAVRLVDMMGRVREQKTDAGRASLKISSDVLYVEGVGAALAAKTIPASQDLIPDVWATRAKDGAVVARAKAAHRADGELTEWEGVPAVVLVRLEGDAEPDFLAQGQLAWDDEFLHVGVRVEGAPSDELGAFELLLGTRPTRQLEYGGWGVYDFTLNVKPSADGGEPSLSLANVLLEKTIENPGASDPSGIQWAVKNLPFGWQAEVSIPRKTLRGFPTQAGPQALTGVLQWKSGGLRSASSRVDVRKTMEWPYLELEAAR